MAQAAGSKVKKRKKSVLKRSRQYREREVVNRHNRTQVRSSLRNFRAAVSTGDVKVSTDLFRPTLAAIDHAIAKGVLTENTGNRYKSRLSLAFNALNAAKAPAKGGKKKSFKKKEKRVVHSGIVHIQATFNNTIVTIADQEGHTIAWSSAGSLGFRGSRKGTPFAAQQAAMTAANKAGESGLRTVEVRVSGPGSGRESAVRALAAAGIDVRSIRDVTPIPHNGCRPPKRRRV